MGVIAWIFRWLKDKTHPSLPPFSLPKDIFVGAFCYINTLKYAQVLFIPFEYQYAA